MFTLYANFRTIVFFLGLYLSFFSGSNETNDRWIGPNRRSQIRPADALHMSWLWSTPSTPIYAFRYGGTMAAPSPKTEWPHAINNGVVFPSVCKWNRHLQRSLDTENSSFQDKDFVYSNADKEFDLVFAALKAWRSLIASYNLQTDIQCKHEGSLFVCYP